MASKPKTPAVLAPPVSLVPEVHKGLRVLQSASVEHMNGNHAAKVYLPEYPRVAGDYPIVFTKDPNTKEFFSVVMWGLEPGENLYIKDDKWIGGFIPASVRCFPFSMTTSSEVAGRLFIGIFEDSTLLNKKEGELIFNDDGTETEWMGKTKDFLVKVYEQEQLTLTLLKELDKLELFVPQSLSYTLPGEKNEKSIDGFYVIDREKLSNLSDEDFLSLRKFNVLEAIYAHLASLDNVQKIISQKYSASIEKK